MRKETRLTALLSQIFAMIAVVAITTGPAIGSDKTTKSEKKPAAGESSQSKTASSNSNHGASTPVKTGTVTGANKLKAATTDTGNDTSAADRDGHGGTATPASTEKDADHGTTTAPAGVLTGAEVLKRLAEGNTRFVTGKFRHPNADAARRAETAAKGQRPTATIVACSDSRVPVEILFDAGIGDLFVVRVAGNVCDTDEIGTIEYGTEHLGTPLLLILGHTKCGAVTAVTKQDQVGGSIPKLVDNIAPAVAAAQKAHPDLHGDDLVPEAVKANVLQSIEDLLKNSAIVRHLTSSGKLKIEGAIYDLEKGTIQWLGKHPNETALLQASGGDNREGVAAAPAGHASATRPSATTQPSDAHVDRLGHADSQPASGHADQVTDRFDPATQPSHEVAAATPLSHEPVAATQPAAGIEVVSTAEHTPPTTQPQDSTPRTPGVEGTKVLGWAPSTRPANGHPSAADQLAKAIATVTLAKAPAAAASNSKSKPAVTDHRPSQASVSLALQRNESGLLERTLADELYRQGAVHLIRGEDAAAAERFRAALEADPNLLPALNDLAGIHYLQHDYDKALELYSKVLAIEPSDESALRGSALACASQKRYTESRDILQELLTKNDRDAQIWLDFGDVQLLMGDKAGAISAWRQAARTKPAAASVIAKAGQRLARYE